MKTSRLSLNQFSSLLVLFLSSSATLINVGRFSGADVWISLLISAVLGTLLFTMYYRIGKLHQFDSLSGILTDLFGKFLGSLILIAYSGYFLFMMASLFKSTSDVVEVTLTVDANMVLIMLLLMIPIVYGLILGVNAIGRSAELLFYFVMLCFIPLVIAVFTSDIFSFDRFLPVLEKGFSPLKQNIYTMTLFPYGESIVFLTIFPLLPKDRKGKILSYSYWAILLATIILLATDVMCVGILGVGLMKNFIYPFFNAMKMVGVNVLFERLDPLAIIIVMITCFFKLSLYFYAGLSCLEKIIRRFNYRQLAVVFSVIIIFIAIHLTTGGVEDIYESILVRPKSLLPIFQLVIPAVVWMMSEFKYHNHPKQLKN